MRELWTSFMRYLTTFHRWRGLQRRAAQSSISLMVADDIHRRIGWNFRGGGGEGFKGL